MQHRRSDETQIMTIELRIPILIAWSLVVVGLGALLYWLVDDAASGYASGIRPSETPASQPLHTDVADVEGPREDVRRNSLIDSPLNAASSDTEDPFLLPNAAGIMGGSVTRQMVGRDYDCIIRRMSRQMMENNIVASTQKRAASLIGFASWEQVEQLLASNRPEDGPLLPTLRQVSEMALEISADVPSYFRDSWNLSHRLEIVDRSIPHDSARWREDNFPEGQRGPKARFRFTGSNAVGDRTFVLYFFSSDHPQLESKLETLEAMQEVLVGMDSKRFHRRPR